ncbi:hypothetical protein [Rubellicoccus peritrichatus]|uniref:Uncharacterized protein n=1 Tax=Rubellicoccus peritrichatus TaxID=3080537 RepID=A0AAQ3LD25_9BACT|nr:hypothetical protein [Puniceicoccus sp. CR14]WOO43152.1 hypothetical protein RZN69_08605 [Puniceicoccus sp. CR14]
MAKGYTATGIIHRLGFEQSELESWLSELKTELRSGNGQVIEWESASESAKKVFSGYSLNTIEAIEEVLYALAELDPENYGKSDIPPYTRASFA